MSRPAVVVSADWSQRARKRSVHVAVVEERRVWRERAASWDLAELLRLAGRLAGRGPVLVGLDLALGVPEGYWAEVASVRRWRGCRTFLDWLARLDPGSGLFAPVRSAGEWRVDRPFFRIPAGKGGLTGFAERVEGGLLRRIDRATGAKPLFAVSGIPGTVGSATRAFWRELIPALGGDREFAVWPFEGELEELLARRPVVLAESYPALAYAATVAEALPAGRIAVAKTRRPAREELCERLAAQRWVREAGVELGDLGPARADEDAFDSLMVAAAALRCLLEGVPLCGPEWIDPRAEGGMLLAGPVDPGARRRRRPAPAAPPEPRAAPESPAGSRSERPRSRRARAGRRHP